MIEEHTETFIVKDATGQALKPSKIRHAPNDPVEECGEADLV